MTAPNMAAIIASLERSLQNCSLNHPQRHYQQNQNSTGSSSGSSTTSGGGGGGIYDLPNSSSSDAAAALELNSQISLPYHWEQCLDLKTGEIYYINWRTGMKAKEDPRTTGESSGDYYSEDEESSYDNEASSSESSPPSSSRREQYHHNQNQSQSHHQSGDQKDHVLVVAGCKSCLMYFMVPKHVEDCPKCTGQLLHFDRSDNASL